MRQNLTFLKNVKPKILLFEYFLKMSLETNLIWGCRKKGKNLKYFCTGCPKSDMREGKLNFCKYKFHSQEVS